MLYRLRMSLQISLFERFAERPIQFEISIGNAGNSTDGFSPLETWADLSSLDDSGMDTCLQATWRSTCPPDTCQTWDKSNYFLQFGDEKPCMYVRWEAVIWLRSHQLSYHHGYIRKIGILFLWSFLQSICLFASLSFQGRFNLIKEEGCFCPI